MAGVEEVEVVVTLFDLAILTLGLQQHLDDVIIASYGSDVERDLIRAWRR